MPTRTTTMAPGRSPVGWTDPVERVVIIGAGMAGLTAANALRHGGVPSVVLEARDRIGGRLHTADVGGSPVDLGGSWIHTPDRQSDDGLGRPTRRRAASGRRPVGHARVGRGTRPRRPGRLRDRSSGEAGRSIPELVEIGASTRTGRLGRRGAWTSTWPADRDPVELGWLRLALRAGIEQDSAAPASLHARRPAESSTARVRR